MAETVARLQRVVLVGPFEVDLRSGELRRGGAVTPLQEQPRKILEMLLTHPGDLVTREDLRQALWPSDTFVDFEHGLNAAVKRLRDALGDSAETPAFIETLPRRGYRLIAAVSQPAIAEPALLGPPPRVPARRQRVPGPLAAAAAVAAVVLVAGVAGRHDPASARSFGSPVVVALPCRLIQGAEQERAYCEGLAETLLAKLSQLTVRHRLQVMPTSELRARTVTDAAAARRELGATHAFQSSVSRIGTSRRINCSLVDTATGAQIDGTTYTADVGDGFTPADRIVEWAVAALALRLTGHEADLLTARGSQNASAQDFVIQGRGYLRDYQKPGSVDTAIIIFERALALEPSHAPALAGLGSAYWLKYEATRDARWVEQARDACGRASAADLRLSAAHACLGTVENGVGEFERARVAFEQALALDPASDDAYRGLGRAHENLGRFDEAEKTYRRAIELRPYYWGGHAWLASFYRTRGRYRDAAQQYAQAVELTPDNARAYASLGTAYTLSGQYEKAIEAYRRSVDLVPNAGAYGNWGATLYRMRRFDDAIRALEEAQRLGPNFRVLANLARACYQAGQSQRAHRLYESALVDARRELSVNPRAADARLTIADGLAKLGRAAEAQAELGRATLAGPHERLFAAAVYVQTGDRNRAFDLLGQAVAERLHPSELTAWIELDPLRSDPRFTALLQAARREGEP